MSTLEVIADAATQAAQGLKAVEDTAIATLVQIERAYEEAVAQVAFLATSRAWAPQVVDSPRQVAAEPAVTPMSEVPPAPPVVVPHVALVPEPRVSPLVEALQALQEAETAETAEAAEEPQPVAEAAPLPEMVPVGPVTEVVELPRQQHADWVAGRHAEAKTDEIPVQAA
ncbi:MAG: hypothetical protein JWR70_403 [Modestobacter sp.]|jgi:hypothetical protein|nr:hypothetical protein [Modestobacter sp.]